MRLIKMLGLAAVAAIAAMAFLGASSAMAEFPTALCTEESETLTCPKEKLVELFDMVAGTTVLKTSLLTVLCLQSLAKLKVENKDLLGHLEEGKKEPLLIETEPASLEWLNCGSNAEHNNCTVTTEKLPLFDVLKTGKDVAKATALGAEVHVNCSGLNCYYGGAAVEGFTVESAAEGSSGMFNAKELSVPKVKGFLCPATSTWTALYEPTHLVEGKELPLNLWVRS